MAEAAKVTVKEEKTVVVEESLIKVALSIDEASALLAVLGRCGGNGPTHGMYDAIYSAIGGDYKPHTVKHSEGRVCGTIYVVEEGR